MIRRAPSVGLLMLAIAAACVPMWWIFGTLQLVVAVSVSLLVGAGIGVLGAVRRWGSLSMLLVALGALAVLAVPLTAPQRIGRGEWGEGLVDAAAAAVLSWRRLLTIGLPVGASDALLMAPVLLVLFGTLIGVWIALRSRSAESAALVPALIGVWSILWGPLAMPVPWLLGMIALVPIGAYITVVRQARRRSRAPRALSSLARRVGAGVAVAVVAAIAAGTAGAMVELPERVVLRGGSTSTVELPGASPMAAYRSFWAEDRRGARQLTATGLVPGDRIRIAALDGYDGEVLTVERAGFERVASAEEGSGRLIGVTIDELSTPWVPTVGVPTGVRFVGERAEQLGSTLHRDRDLRTLIVEAGLRPGDGFQMQVEQGAPIVPPEQVQELVPADPVRGAIELPEEMLTALAAWTGDAETPGARLRAMIAGMRASGYISHGVLEDEAPSRPGHSRERLTELFAEPMIGDAEQYSTAAMLLARQLGFDARVVVGFTPDAVEAGLPTPVVGADADAWIEVRTSAGWVGIDVSPAPRPIPEQEQGAPAIVEQPPAQQAPAPAPGGQRQGADAAAPNAPERSEDSASRLLAVLGAVGAVLGLLSLVAALPVGLVVAKVVRRRRRRRADEPRDRAEGAWAEVVDGLRDRGDAAPEGGTRLEQAGEDDRMRELAHRVDRAVFAPRPPSEPEVDAAWALSDAVLERRDEGDGRLRPLLARLNPASLVRR